MLYTRFRHLLSVLGREKWGLTRLFAVALLPGVLIGLFLCFAIYTTERDQLEKGALQTARALLQAVDSEVETAQATVRVLSTSSYLAEQNLPAFYEQAKQVVAASGMGRNIVLSDLSGQQILNTAQPFGATLPRHGNLPQFNRVLTEKRIALSDLYLGPVLRKPVFSVDAPVFVQGKPAYVLSMGLMPEHFSLMLKMQNLPEGWIAALLDTQRTVVARNLNPEESVGKQATPDFQAQLNQRAEGVMASRSLEGTPTFLAYTRSATTGWTLGVGMTRAVLYKNLYRWLALVVLSFGVFLACGAVLVGLFSRYVRRSLEALGVVAAAAARGDRSVKASTVGLREIDALVARLNDMQEQQKEMEDAVRRMAYYDALTQLPNRSLLKDRLTQALRASKRTARHGLVLFLDLDNFKSLNDTQGHVVGDMLLVEVARRLKNLVRELDTVSRFGGDEFVVLLQDLDPDPLQAHGQASQLAEKIRRVLAEPYLLQVPTHEGLPARNIVHDCTASIGAVLFMGAHVSEDEIIRRADQAMYQSKASGRDQVSFYGSPQP